MRAAPRAVTSGSIYWHSNDDGIDIRRRRPRAANLIGLEKTHSPYETACEDLYTTTTSTQLQAVA